MSNAPSDLPLVVAGGRQWPLRLVRHAAARRYRLVFDAVRGELRLTVPRRASERQALAWAREQHLWIARQAEGNDGPETIGPGSILPLRGVERHVVWEAGAPRKVTDDGRLLRLGGPVETLGPRLGRWLKSEALALLDAESRALAARHDIAITGVAVGDPRSRWGSCAADGRLRYSWRLLLAPDFVRQATVAHEVAHRVHMHHGPEFHALVDELYGASALPARQWLRAHGRGLHRYRFSPS